MNIYGLTIVRSNCYWSQNIRLVICIIYRICTLEEGGFLLERNHLNLAVFPNEVSNLSDSHTHAKLKVTEFYRFECKRHSVIEHTIILCSYNF